MKSVIVTILAFIAVGCVSVPKPIGPQSAIPPDREHREVYTMNNEGGVITLTNEPCDKQAPPGIKWFYATSETNDPEFEDGLIDGCWLFALDYPGIIIHWETGHAAAIINPSRLSSRRPESFVKPQTDNIKGEY